MTRRHLDLRPPLLLCLLIALGLALAWPPQAAAHGVTLQAEAGQAVVVSGVYSDGEAMSFVKIKVIDPQGKTHQLGNADAKGRFAFVASHPGNWQVMAEDGMGHRGQVTWEQGAQASPVPVSKLAVSASKWERAAWGLSLLFWLSGLVFWRKGIRSGG